MGSCRQTGWQDGGQKLPPAAQSPPPPALRLAQASTRALALCVDGGADADGDVFGALWACLTDADVLAKEQAALLERGLGARGPLARHVRPWAADRTVQQALQRQLAQVLASPSRMAKADALFELVGREFCRGAAAQLAGAVSLMQRPAPLRALARALALDRSLGPNALNELVNVAAELCSR